MSQVSGRIFLERMIARQCIADLLAAGFLVSVNDGEETTLKRSTDAAAIYAAMFTTDGDLLTVRTGPGGAPMGWVRFVYGNDGWDVINDYTTNLETALARTTALAESMDGGDFFARCEAALVACDGIPTEALKTGIVADLVDYAGDNSESGATRATELFKRASGET